MRNEPTEECSRLKGQKTRRSRGAEGPNSFQKLKEDNLGRNITVFTEGRLSEEQGWEKRDFRRLDFTKMLLKSLLCSINSDNCSLILPSTHVVFR